MAAWCGKYKNDIILNRWAYVRLENPSAKSQSYYYYYIQLNEHDNNISFLFIPPPSKVIRLFMFAYVDDYWK